MGKINWTRVILGGLVAGLIINLFEYLLNAVVLAKDWANAMSALGKTGEISGTAVALFNVWGSCLVWSNDNTEPSRLAGCTLYQASTTSGSSGFDPAADFSSSAFAASGSPRRSCSTAICNFAWERGNTAACSGSAARTC